MICFCIEYKCLFLLYFISLLLLLILMLLNFVLLVNGFAGMSRKLEIFRKRQHPEFRLFPYYQYLVFWFWVVIFGTRLKENKLNILTFEN